jgi:hypothetical protein
MLLIVNQLTKSGQLLELKNKTLSKLVTAALELPMSKDLLNRNYSLSIVRRCWEDQLRLKSRLNNKKDPTLDIHLYI